MFQKRPQDLPAAPALFWVVLPIYAVISSFLSFFSQSVSIAVMVGILQALLLVVITWLFLYLRSVPSRWMQTCSAIAGTDVIFGFLYFPLFYLLGVLSANSPIQQIVLLIIVCVFIWNIAVTAHILKNALSSSYLLGVLTSLTYVALLTFTVQSVFPTQAAS